MYVLRDLDAEQGLHPKDLLWEMSTVTLVAGTLEVPTQFANGQIKGAIITDVGDGGVNSVETFNTDLVVTSAAVTVSGKTGSTATVCVVFFANPQI